jgi:hypothetical protein
MANKALATRQKMRLRVEPSQGFIHQPSKPRKPVAVAAKQRAAGPHARSKVQERLAAKALLKKAKLVADEDE